MDRPDTPPEQQCRILFAAGIAHGTLRVVSDLLTSPEPIAREVALRQAHQAVTIVERLIFLGEKGDLE